MDDDPPTSEVLGPSIDPGTWRLNGYRGLYPARYITLRPAMEYVCALLCRGTGAVIDRRQNDGICIDYSGGSRNTAEVIMRFGCLGVLVGRIFVASPSSLQAMAENKLKEVLTLNCGRGAVGSHMSFLELMGRVSQRVTPWMNSRRFGEVSPRMIVRTFARVRGGLISAVKEGGKYTTSSGVLPAGILSSETGANFYPLGDDGVRTVVQGVGGVGAS
nr:related to 3-oxoacyl-reductase [imported] - Neurospora crassa [Neurospora crassa]